ncbi:BRO family protein [Lactobacillus delbrueckii]|uniref:BRO family protein n=1 Tax=Lactobacillus delbrueckii TaxID=1584 RepID=UPI001F1C35F9|nr:BRO family protein [Lactobacillus delbrueckii]GHN43048.1 antirepressor [Lactobacillus delbrueckii]
MEIFDFEDTQVRVIEEHEQVWFVGKDVASILGYSQTAKAIREHVDEEDKGVSVLDTPGGKQQMTIVNESGLYSLVLSSKLPTAKKFKHWVTSEVLPAIRKHGGYSAQQAEPVDLPRKPVDILRLTVQALDEQNERLDKLEETFEQFKAEEPLSPGEYNYIGKLTGRAVRSFLAVADVNHGVPANQEQRSELYRDINTGVLQVTGVRTRANLRKRDFDVVCDYVARWTPSVATRMELERQADRQEEFDF